MATEPDLEAKYANNGKVMVGSAILLFILILIVILFRIYVYLCRRRRRRLLSQNPLTTTTTLKEERLDPSVLKSLPTFTYSSSSSSATRRPLQDCAVCLSDFTDGDEGRTLPNCNHSFHSHCIDTWFASHSTCPLCRAPVRPATVSSHTEPCPVSVSEAGEGCSYFPEPIGCPSKPLSVIVELPEANSGSDPVPGDHGFKCSLKRLCNV